MPDRRPADRGPSPRRRPTLGPGPGSLVDDATSSDLPPAPTGAARLGDGMTVAGSARVLGRLWAGPRTYLAQGAIVRSLDGVELGHDSAVLEGCVVIGTTAEPVSIGRKTVFGHRCTVIGAAIGDLCEIGNASVLLPGSSVGTGCFLGERTLVPAGCQIPSGSVVVGQPARIVRAADEADQRRLLGLRAGDLRLHEAHQDTTHREDRQHGQPLHLPRHRTDRRGGHHPVRLVGDHRRRDDRTGHDHRRRCQDHRRLARPGPHRRTGADPGERRAPPAAGQRPPHRGRRQSSDPTP